MDLPSSKQSCSFCLKEFSSKSNLNRHIKQIHSTADNAVFICTYCDRHFNQKSNLHRHLLMVHLGQMFIEGVQKKYACCEEGCKVSINTARELREHLNKNHNMTINMEETSFPCYNEFQNWKGKLEEESKTHFAKHTGTKSSPNGNYEYFYCFRSGVYEKSGKNNRACIKSVKSGNLCTAELSVLIKEDESVFVTYCDKHYGHKDVIGLLRLTEEEKRNIASKIKQNISSSNILQEVRDSLLSSSQVKRKHLITHQDIANITRQFGLKLERHSDDATSVKILCEGMIEMGPEKCPILGHKFQGETSSNFIELNVSDFFLVFQHPLQKEMMLKFCHKIVCVDSTHGTNIYDFKLITILIIDDFNEGFPAFNEVFSY